MKIDHTGKTETHSFFIQLSTSQIEALRTANSRDGRALAQGIVDAYDMQNPKVED